MSDNQESAIHSASGGSTTASHPAAAPVEIFAGTSTSSEFNTVRLRPIPVACWKVEDILFAFDSSFVTPDIAAEIQQLQSLREKHKRPNPVSGKVEYPPLSLFGHADPVGPAVDPDGYNKSLSGRRASAIYAVLIHNTDPGKALSLWQQISSAENWGADQQQVMQSNVASGSSPGSLMGAYMETLCPADFKLTAQDFLAQGADSGGKGDYQGCSSFNPLLLFSQTEQDQFAEDKQGNDQQGIEARNAANACNRRVLVLLFRPGSIVLPAKWPCPPAAGDKSGCIKRFWSNGDTRRHTLLPDAERKFEETHDTFACRFYQRISEQSPCNGTTKQVRIRLYDGFQLFIPSAPFEVSIGEGQPVKGTADDQGIATVTIVAGTSSCEIHWGFKPDQGEQPVLFFRRTIFLIDVDGTDVEAAEGDGTESDTAMKILSNLGYHDEDSQRNIVGFQLDYGHLRDPYLIASGELDDETIGLLKEVYQDAANNLRRPTN
jgi:hypothetical protein